jgi:hypothetical protein
LRITQCCSAGRAPYKLAFLVSIVSNARAREGYGRGRTPIRDGGGNRAPPTFANPRFLKPMSVAWYACPWRVTRALSPPPRRVRSQLALR